MSTLAWCIVGVIVAVLCIEALLYAKAIYDDRDLD